MRSAVAVLLAGCGRLGFDGASQADGTVGDGLSAEASPDADLRNLCETASIAPATIHLRGFAFRYTSFENERTPLSDATIAAMGASTRSAQDGSYDLALATNGAPLSSLVVRYTLGADFVTDVHFDTPVERDITGPYTAVLTLGDGPIWNAVAMNSIYSTAALTRDPSRGLINIAARDCFGVPIAGAAIDIQPPPEALLYQADDGQLTAGETQPRYGQAFAMNAPAGPTTIHVTHPAHTFADVSVTVLPGAVNTLVVARTTD